MHDAKGNNEKVGGPKAIAKADGQKLLEKLLMVFFHLSLLM